MAQLASAPSRGARRVRAPRFLLAIPAWVLFVVFFSIPLLWIVYYSFGYKPNIFRPIATDKLSLQQYRDGLSGSFIHLFSQTLQIAVIGTFLCLLVAFPFAYWLATRVSPRWRGLLLGLVVVPFFVNFLMRTIGWLILLSPSGPVSTLLQDWGLRSEPLHLLQTRGAVQLGVVYNYLALMILPLFVTLDRLDPAMREASKDLGASRWKTFRQVTVPMAAPGIAAGLLLVFIPLAGDYITAIVLGGAKGLMAGAQVASDFNTGLDWALGSAQAVILIVMILTTVGVFAVLGLAIRAIARARRRIELPEPASVTA